MENLDKHVHKSSDSVKPKGKYNHNRIHAHVSSYENIRRRCGYDGYAASAGQKLRQQSIFYCSQV